MLIFLYCRVYVTCSDIFLISDESFFCIFFFFKQKTAYELRISDWSSDVCSSDLHGLNRDLGFTEADRIENIRRVGEVAKLMTDAGLIVITAFISPFRVEREMVRGMLPEGEFIEVFIDTPLAEAERRDVKGLRSEEHTSELQSLMRISYAVFCLKKKKKHK